MFSFSRTLLLLAGLGAVPAQAAIATGGMPGLICRQYPAETLQGLRQGDLRLVIIVQAYTPPAVGAAGLAVWLVPAQGAADIELARVAIHPRQAFKAYQRARWQRFMVALAPQGAHLQENQPLCIKVGFAAGQGQGAITFDMELI